MAAKTTVTVKGLDELLGKIARIGSALRGPGVEAGARAGAEVIAEEMRVRAPRRRGVLAGAIGTNLEESSSVRAVVEVGPEADAFYGGIVEVGHAIKRSRKGATLGYVPPHPFMRPALDSREGQASEAAASELRQRVLQAAV